MITVYNEANPDEKLGYKIEPEDTIIMYHGSKYFYVPSSELTEALCTGFTFQPTTKEAKWKTK